MYAYKSKDILAYEGFLLALEVPAALLDEKGRVLVTNPDFPELGDIIPDAFGHFAISDLMHQVNALQFDAFLAEQRHRAAGTGSKFRTTLHVKPKHMNVSITPFMLEGSFIGFLCQGSKDPDPELKKLAYLMENLDQGVWDYDVLSDTFTVSDAWWTIRGLSKDIDYARLGQDWLTQIHPDDRPLLQAMFEGQANGTSDGMEIQYRHLHKDGHWVWILCRANVVERDTQGMPLRLVGTDTDISALKEKDAAFSQMTNRLQLAVEVSEMGLWEYSENEDMVVWDDRILEIYGLKGSHNKRAGHLWQNYIHPEDRQHTLAEAAYCQENGLDMKVDFRIVRPCGEIRHLRSLARNIMTANDGQKLIGVNIDVTEHYTRTNELEAIRKQLEYESRHDALTGIGNRRLMDEHVNSFTRSVSCDQTYAVLHLDLDHFKQINDTFGHEIGDSILRFVGKSLVEIVGPHGVPFRLGGDEFTVFFSRAPSVGRLEEICEDLLDRLNSCDGSVTGVDNIKCSIGCALTSGLTYSVAETFRHADQALYSAKEAGRNQVKIRES